MTPTRKLRETRSFEGLRLRAGLVLLGGAGMGSTALIVSITVTTLVAENITGGVTWSGVPVAAAILGTAVGTALLAMAMTRWGRRVSLATCYVAAGIGAFLACAAAVMVSLPLLITGALIVGLGNSANALTRYVAADLQRPERRATTLGWIVWAGTIGAVIGPTLLSPSDRIGVSLGLPSLAGAYLVSGLIFLGAAVLYVLFLRPDPSLLSRSFEIENAPRVGIAASTTQLFHPPQVRVSIVTLVFSHVVMVLIMTMTPLHLKSAGHGLDVIGLVASSHIVGMFLFAPLTGLLVDRVGSSRVIFIGQALLLLSTLGAIVVPPSGVLWMGATLFLLGLGWNFGFVAGSSSLTRDIPTADRVWLQGRTDSIVWAAAAAASLLSSVLFSTVGFAGLSAFGSVAVLVALGMITIFQRKVVSSIPDGAK